MIPSEQDICSECGRSLPDRSLGKRCPNCLLQLALTPPPEELVADIPVIGDGRPKEERRFFAGYELCGEISRGGMGVVYRARQFDPAREVALKMIHPAGQATPAARLRFQVEVSAVARLHHPRIVSLYESGEHDGVCFYSMRLVEGTGLDEWLRNKKPPPLLKERVALLLKVAEAVQYAHDRGILHRDLKPSNILMDRNDEPCVADFGLAKIQEADAGITLDQSVIGSPSYMAPEQAASDGAEITTAADVYSLGAILYELLTGHPPFLADNAFETIRRVREESPVAPRQRNPELPRDLDSVCLKALEKKPANRYASAQAFADDLRRFLDGDEVLARPISPLNQCWRWARRRPALAALILVTLVSLIVLAVGSSVAARRLQIAGEATQQLVRQLRHEKAENYLDKGETGKGLAVLAYLLREDPQDEVVGNRMISALTQRAISVPPVRPWIGGAPILTVGFSGDGTTSFTVSGIGRFRRVDLNTGKTWDAQLSQGGQTLLFAHAHPSGEALMVAHHDGTLTLHSPEDPEVPIAVLKHEMPLVRAVFGATPGSLVSLDQKNALTWWTRGSAPGASWTAKPLDGVKGQSITALALSPVNDQVALGTETGDVQWHSLSGADNRRGTVKMSNRVEVLLFDRSGQQLAAASNQGELISVNLTGGNGGVQVRSSMPVMPTDLDFSPDGGLLAGCGWSRVQGAFVWDTRSGERLTDSLRHNSHVRTVRFSPDGRELITLGHDNNAQRWEVGTWENVGEPLVHVTPPFHVAYARNGRHLVTGSYTGTVWWDVSPTVADVQNLEHSAMVRRAIILPQSGEWVTTTVDGQLRSWNAATHSLNFSIEGLPERLLSIEHNHAGSLIAGFGATGVVRFWSSTDGTRVGKVIDSGTPIYGVAFHPDDRWVVTAGTDGVARCWDLVSGEQVLPLMNHGAELFGVEFSPDGQQIATFGQDGRLRLWSAKTGAFERQPIEMESGIRVARFSSSGRWLAAAGDSIGVDLWEVNGLSEATTPLKHQNEVSMIAFSPDERFLASASVDGSALVLSLAGERVPALLPHEAAVRWVEFSSDGRWLSTMTQEGVARVWDPVSGLPVTEPMRHSGSQDARAHFDTSGSHIATVGGDARVCLWRLPQYQDRDASTLISVAELVGRVKLEGDNRFVVSPLQDWEKLPVPFNRAALLSGR